MIVVVGNWLLLGSAAFLVVSALGEADVRLLPFVVFASTFAMLAGLIAIVPMGIGVRDAAFAILLSLAMPAPVAVAASLAFRAVSVAADFACAGSWLLATVGERASRR
jgi:uncharacterized membrane protein YbhN (UPF0104 family)